MAKIKSQESIKVGDSNKVTVEISSIIYLNEFLKYKDAYEREEKQETLVFMFIFLQVYTECFLHQNMRQIMHMEFEFKEPTRFKKWASSEEKMHISKKLQFFTSFFGPKEKLLELREMIESLNTIGQTRNKLVHGYRLTKVVVDEMTHKSETLSLLSLENLKKSLQSVNNFGNAWNKLLDEILSECKALRSVEDFKLKLFKVD